MENKIVIDLKKNLLENSEIQFLNNKEECIICSQDLNNNDLVLINNLCKCYNAAKICEECLIKWINENDECMICRKKYSSVNKMNIYHIKDDTIKKKIENVSIEINHEDEISDDTLRLININQFTSYRTFKMWVHNNKCKLLRYSIGYGLLALALISIKETIELENADYNHTHSIFI